MMENSTFPSISQEAQRAANELQEIKLLIRELLIRMNQIEKRLKVISPEIITKKTKQETAILQQYTDEYLRNKYEMFVGQFRNNAEQVVKELQSTNKDELLQLVKFLGCQVSKNPTEKKLVDLAIGRLKESNLLRG